MSIPFSIHFSHKEEEVKKVSIKVLWYYFNNIILFFTFLYLASAGNDNGKLIIVAIRCQSKLLTAVSVNGVTVRTAT